jgi:hypothetical protein
LRYGDERTIAYGLLLADFVPGEKESGFSKWKIGKSKQKQTLEDSMIRVEITKHPFSVP